MAEAANRRQRGMGTVKIQYSRFVGKEHKTFEVEVKGSLVLIWNETTEKSGSDRRVKSFEVIVPNGNPTEREVVPDGS